MSSTYGNEEITDMDNTSVDTTSHPRGWASVEMRPKVRDYLHETALMMPGLGAGAIGLYAGLHGDWAGVSAAVWWVLVGIAGSEVAESLIRLFTLARARAVVMRCIGCGLHVPAGRDGDPELVAHLGGCAPAGGEVVPARAWRDPWADES